MLSFYNLHYLLATPQFCSFAQLLHTSCCTYGLSHVNSTNGSHLMHAPLNYRQQDRDKKGFWTSLCGQSVYYWKITTMFCKNAPQTFLNQRLLIGDPFRCWNFKIFQPVIFLQFEVKVDENCVFFLDFVPYFQDNHDIDMCCLLH